MQRSMVLIATALLLATPQAASAAPLGLFDPLFVQGNRWQMTLPRKAAVEVVVGEVRQVGKAEVALLHLDAPKDAAGGEVVPAKVCLARIGASLVLFDIGEQCSDAALRSALAKSPSPLMTDPPSVYKHEKKQPEGEAPIVKSVSIAQQKVMGQPASVATYSYSESFGLKVSFSAGVGLVSLDYDGQSGGSSLALVSFAPASGEEVQPPPIVAASPADLGVTPGQQAAMEKFSGGTQVSGDMGNGEVTVLLRLEGRTTELVVLRDGREVYSQRYGAHPPRWLTFEAATGEVSMFFDLGKDPYQTARSLSFVAAKKSYVIGKVRAQAK
jgi:hypothetical protein